MGESSKSERDDLINDLRALMIASQGGLPLHNIRRELDETGGDVNAHRQFGFRTLEDFVRAHPDQFRIRGDVVFAHVKETSAHISSLVAGQRSKKKSRNLGSRYRGGPRRPLAPRTSYNPPRQSYNPPPRFSEQRRSAPPQPLMNRANDRPAAAMSAPLVSGSHFRHETAAPAQRPEVTRVNDQQPQRTVVITTTQGQGREVTVRKPWTIYDVNERRHEPPSTRPSINNNSTPTEGEVTPTEREVTARRPWPKDLFVNTRRNEPRSTHTSTNNNYTPSNFSYSKSIPERELPEVVPIAKPRKVVIQKPKMLPPVDEQDIFLNVPQNIDITVDSAFSENESPNRTDEWRSESMPTVPAVPAMAPEQKVITQPPIEYNVRAFVQPPSHRHPPGFAPLLMPYPDAPPSHPQPPGFVPPLMPTERKFSIADRFTFMERPEPKEISKDSKPSMRDQLEELFKINGLGRPDIQMLSQRDGNVTTYIGLLKLGNHVIKGHTPVKTQEAAIEILARCAVISLTNASRSTSSSAEFLNNVVEMMVQNGRTLWLNSLPDQYYAKYSKEVPEDWLDIVSKAPVFSFDSTNGRQMISLSSKQISQMAPPGFEPLKPQDNCTLAEAAQVSLPSSPKLRELPPLEFPDGRHWDLLLLNYYCTKPQQLFVRILGEEWSDALHDVLNNFELETAEQKMEPVEELIEGELYMGKDSEMWMRCRYLSSTPEGKAYVFNVDDGDYEEIETLSMFHLSDSALNVPAQAFCLSLYGLESLPNMDAIVQSINKHLLRQIRVMELKKFLPSESGVPCVSGIIFDTSTPDDINVNQLVLEEVTMQLAPVNFSKCATLNMVISSVDDSLYLREMDRGPLKCIDCLIDLMHDLMAETPREPVTEILCEKIFLAVDEITGKLSRCQLKGVPTKAGHVLVRFIDYGHSQEVPMADLIDAETYSHALVVAPPQAVKVNLTGVPVMTEEVRNQLRLYSQEDTALVVRTVDFKFGTPVVEIMFKCPETKSWLRINEILIKNDIMLSDESVLGAPVLPEVGMLFYVEVILAANPGLFQVQLIEYAEELQDLMCQLQDEHFERSKVPEVDTLKSGMYCAVKHTSSWYRGKLITMTSANAFCVELTDFGKILAVVPVESIRPLPKKFTALPKQAIHASLAEVSPAGGDWTPSDCVMFNDLVIQKQLAAYLVAIRTNNERRVLELRLVDTSQEDDVDIASYIRAHSGHNGLGH